MSAYSEFRIGWPVVVSSLVGIALGMSPLPFYTIGVFAGQLTAEFGWGIDKVLSGLAIFTVAGMVASPLVGMLSDRLGVRRVALSSIFLFSLCFMAFALNNGSLVFYYALWILLAFCGAGTLPMTFTRALSNWFHQKRGLALGIALVGTGIAGALSKLFAAYVVAEAGWRVGYVAVGALPLLIALPIGFLLFHDIDDPRVSARALRLRQLHSSADSDQESQAMPVYGLTLREAFADWRFWLIAVIFVPLSFGIGGPFPNLETMMGDKGFSSSDAVFIASCLGYAVVVGRLLGGFLLDHIWAPLVACVLLILPAISMYLLTADAISYSTAISSVFLLGMAAGMEYDLLAYLVGRYFGIRAYSSIYGALYIFFALGAGFGPAIFGRVFEATGSYNLALNWSMWAFIFCSLALLLLGPYRDKELRAMVD
ncbi:MAG: MFS transporter [Congregibacter sp.]